MIATGFKLPEKKTVLVAIGCEQDRVEMTPALKSLEAWHSITFGFPKVGNFVDD